MKSVSLAAVLLGLSAGFALAQSASPAGLWEYLDLDTGKTRAHIRVTEQNGALNGVIETPFPKPGEIPICDKCPGDLKGKPIKGLRIMSGVRRTRDGWDGGKIVDADSGSVYDVRLTPSPDGKTTEVRGYLGPGPHGGVAAAAIVQRRVPRQLSKRRQSTL